MGASILTLTAMSAAATEEIKTCECGCCVDARERIRCRAFLAYARGCSEPAFDDDGNAVEPCACVFCVEQVASPPERVRYELDVN